MFLNVILLTSVLLETALCLKPYTEDCGLGYRIMIKSVKTGEYLGVPKGDLKGTKIQAVPADAKEFYLYWNLKTSLGYYIIELFEDSSFIWDHSSGCSDGDEEMVLYNNEDVSENNKLYYNMLTEMITLCEGKCVYVNPSDKTLRSESNCTDKEDKIFEFEALYPMNHFAYIKSIKTGLYIGAPDDLTKEHLAAVDKNSKDHNLIWKLEPSGNGQYFAARLAKNLEYYWDHVGGCFSSQEIILYKIDNVAHNNEIEYDPDDKTLKICDECIYIDPEDNTIKSSKDCDGDDKLFEFEASYE